MREMVIRICRLMFDRHYLVSTDGNVSARLNDGFLVTPSGRNKGLIEAEDLVEVDSLGRARVLGAKPSSEFLMHLKYYEHRPDVQAVLHCHPTYATVFACTNWELSECLMTESVIGLGSVPKAPLAIPSTKELAEGLEGLVQQSNAILLANHGLVVAGSSLEDAFNRLETVEHFARILYLSRLTGAIAPIPTDKIKDLQDLRKKYGLQGPFANCQPCEDMSSETLIKLVTEEILKRMR